MIAPVVVLFPGSGIDSAFARIDGAVVQAEAEVEEAVDRQRRGCGARRQGRNTSRGRRW